MKKGKRFSKAIDLVEKDKFYSLEEACNIMKQTASAKFDETIELSVRLNVDPKKADQNVRGTVTLPHGTGKTKRVAVVAKGEKLGEAEKSGADIVGSEDLIKQISSGKIDFDVIVATPDMMRELGKIGKILGPKGLMPSPKSGTVTFEIAQTVKNIKTGQVQFRVDEYGIIHLGVGKASFSGQALAENISALMEGLIKSKPGSIKGDYVKSISVSSSMGPGIRLNPRQSFEVQKHEG